MKNRIKNEPNLLIAMVCVLLSLVGIMMMSALPQDSFVIGLVYKGF